MLVLTIATLIAFLAIRAYQQWALSRTIRRMDGWLRLARELDDAGDVRGAVVARHIARCGS